MLLIFSTGSKKKKGSAVCRLSQERSDMFLQLFLRTLPVYHLCEKCVVGVTFCPASKHACDAALWDILCNTC